MSFSISTSEACHSNDISLTGLKMDYLIFDRMPLSTSTSEVCHSNGITHVTEDRLSNL